MAKTVKMDTTAGGGVVTDPNEIINENPRKMSEIIADKKAALKTNEELLRALQKNEYDIPFGSVKLYKQVLKFLEEEIAIAEKKMEYSIAMNPIIIYMRKRLDTVKEQLESSND